MGKHQTELPEVHRSFHQMKFLLVSPFTSASGSAIRFWNIAASLVEAGHTVVYSDRKASGVDDLHRSSAVRYCQCPSTGIKPLDIFFSLLFFTLLFFRHMNCSVFYALKPAPNNCLPALLARCLGKKIVLDVDDLDYAYLKPGKSFEFFRFFFDLFPRYFHLVTYHTPNLGIYLSKKAAVPENRLFYFAQGISPEFFSVSLPDQKDITPRSLIYVATLGITSDFEALIPGLKQICERFTDCSITIVGDGCRREEFKSTISDLGIAGHVTFTGTIPHKELPKLLARHQIGINYMQPTPVNNYRAILKIREYLACGLEVVCNNVGDVDPFRQFIHIHSTIDDMLHQVETLFERGVHRTLNGRNYIEKEYSWSPLTAHFLRRLEQR